MKDISLYPQLSTEKDTDLIITTKRIKSYPLHWHDFFEIELIKEGSGTHILNGKKYPISKGCAYLLRPADYHEITSEEGEGEIEIVNVTFKAELLNEALLLSILHSERTKSLYLDKKCFDALETAVDLLGKEQELGGEYKKQMLEYLTHFFVDKKGSALNPEQLSGINKALVYLEFHFREPIRLSTLAREAGFNPTYFSELFKATTGETYIEKLNGLRLEYACTLLSHNYSVSFACFESGFGSLSNFFTAFKKKYGVSPREYAKKKG